MRFQRSRLHANFRVHMSDTHGADWLRQLTIFWTRMRPADLQCLRRGEGPNGHMGVGGC
jgi:hypothetical protein